ncbi:redoxin domain-containing protein [Halolamina salifodinae]|uniref:Peroxiredoxin n=1 Tax=Halolamina salifodinae TaxID=1202767 RepID=A0A8T4GYW2_9EURY|nr:redoxin domain-containing protein [Halolamina salifodinae]MBP1986744.1 peroxiredoxin [Halolamina salifodinae]
MDDSAPAVGDAAPQFTAPVADDEGITSRSLDAYFDGTPTVLAFYPAAFSNTCTTEFCTFRDRLGPLASGEATVLGISTDLPWALAEFREAESLPFPLVSDNVAAIAADYGVRTQFERLGIDGTAQRSVFVVDAEGRVTYRWLADDSGQEPDYEAVEEAVRAAAD